VDVLFLPAVAELYPGEVPDVTVIPGALASQWEGAVRPGHFAGVLTVVAKLFNIVGADVAVFGQKDLQQLTLVRAMVRALDFPVEIVGAPTAREVDGLAMSSRNSFLDAGSRQRALALSRALRAVARAFDEGERDVERLEKAGGAVLAAEPEVRVDYLAVVEPRELTRVPCAAAGSAAMVAARVGVTRLIDNVILGAA
jgi:pantoate--beta-alanine ligase